eukprot:g16768.t1
MGRRSSAEGTPDLAHDLTWRERSVGGAALLSEDQRFEGQIVKYLVDKGYGFIRCQELRQSRYPDRDIFLHQKQLGNFKEGDAVSFGIFLNRDGKPQATELAYLNGGGEQQYQQQGQYPQQSQQYQQQSQHQQYPQEYQQQQYQQYSQQQYQQGQYQQYSQEYQSQDHYGMQGQGGDQAAVFWTQGWPRCRDWGTMLHDMLHVMVHVMT